MMAMTHAMIAAAGDRSDASGKYWIIGTDRSEFIVTDGQSIYKTGEQIIASKLTTKVGEAATTQVRTITFNDQDAIAPLQQLASAYPNAAIFLSGSLTVDLPDDVKVPIQPDQYQTVSLSGATVQMNFHPLEKAIAVLSEQYAIGTVTAKIIQPRPELK